MAHRVETYLQSLKPREKVMGAIVLVMLFGYIFYEQVYLAFERDNNFLWIRKMALEQDVNGVKALTATKPIAQIKEENTQNITRIDALQEEKIRIEEELLKVDSFDINDYGDRYLLNEDVENNSSKLVLKGELTPILKVINRVNQYYKIEHFILDYKSHDEITSIIQVQDRVINPFNKSLSSVESPFFNIKNVFELTSVIGSRVKINGRWYSQDENLSKSFFIYKVKSNSVLLKDSKGRLKEIILE